MNGVYIGKKFIIKTIFLIGLFLSLLPNILLMFPITISLIWRLWVPFIWGCLFLFVYKKLYKDKIILTWLALLLYMNVITYINSGRVEGNANICYFITAVILGGYMCKHDREFFLHSITYYLTIVLALNTLLWRPGGTYVNNFGQISFVIGTKTMITYYQLIAFLFAYVFFKTEKNKAKGSFILAVNIVSVLIYNVLQPISTSKVCLLLFLLLIVVDTLTPKFSRLLLTYLFWIINILDVAIVVFRVQYLFKYLLVDVLNEDLTLDNRTYIWDEVLYHILKKPIWGYGNRSEITFLTALNKSTHNQLLGWAFYLGIVGLIIMLVFAVKIMNRYSIYDVRGRISRMTFILCATMWISEYWMSYPIYIYMTILLSNLHLYQISDNKNVLAKYVYIRGKNE